MKSWKDRHNYLSDAYEGPPPTQEELERARGTFRLAMLLLCAAALIASLVYWSTT